jgi:hypothetical protein
VAVSAREDMISRPNPMTLEPCECLRRVMRAVNEGKAHCNRHSLFGQKIGGIIRASRVPFPQTLGTLHLRAPFPVPVKP